MTQALQIIQSFRCGAIDVPPYRAVTLDATGNVIVTPNGASAIGIATEAGGDANQMMDVLLAGVAYGTLGAAPLAPATYLTCNNAGKLITAPINGSRVIGVLLEPGTTIDQIAKIMISLSIA